MYRWVALAVSLAALTACKAQDASLEILRQRGATSSRGCKDVGVQPGDQLQVAVRGPDETTGQILLQSDGEPTQFLAGVLLTKEEQLAPPEPFVLPAESGHTVIVLVIDDEERARCSVRMSESG